MLYVVVLSPVLMLSLALAVEVGALQLQRQRLASALDQAVVVASGSAAHAVAVAELDPHAAADDFRTALVENLTPLASALAGVTPADVARTADVVVVTDVPGPDPFAAGVQLLKPTIAARIHASVRTGLLAAAGLPSTTDLTLTARGVLGFTGAN